MRLHLKAVAASAVCALIALPAIVMAQVPVNAHPKKAAPTAALSKPIVAGTVVRPTGVTLVAPHKPPVVTAVVPGHPVTHDTHGIIFVGGKPQGGSKVELNPQPIPPGYAH